MGLTPKPLVWMADTLECLKRFPEAVGDEIGYALFLAQIGGKHPNAKPLKGLGSGLLEVVSDHRGDTFRAAYTVKLAGKIYVLHVFQKKSRHGIATPKGDIELIRRRLLMAEELHARQERSE